MGLDPGVAENRQFQERYAPLTWGIGFVKMPCRETTDAFWRWLEDIGQVERYRLHRREIEGGLEQALQTLSPMYTHFTSRRLFVSTKSGWTAYFDNNMLGTDAHKVRVIAKRESCHAFSVVSVPLYTYEHAGKRYRSGGQIEFQVVGRKQGLSDAEFATLRAVGVGFDETKWHFQNYGDPLPFENVEAYARHRIQDRFTHEMLIAYAYHFGLSPFDESFYQVDIGTPAVLIESQGDTIRGIRVVKRTLREVQAWLGLWE